MNYEALMFSVLFFIVFSIYAFFTIYVLHLNPKAVLNKVFAGVCISLCVWSLGFSLSVSAPDAGTAELWRRFSIFGYAAAYVLMLQFLLYLTDSKLLRTRWIQQLLYIPCAYTIIAYSLSLWLPVPGFHMIKAWFGWTNITNMSVLDIIFFVYYIGYFAASLIIVWRWKSKNPDKATKRQANLILVSFTAAFLLGSLIDVIIPAFKRPLLPEMAPVAILIPISVFYYLVQRYGLMNNDPLKGYHQIISEKTRMRLFQMLSVIFAAAGILSFIYEYLMTQQATLENALVNAALLMSFGVLFFFNQRSRSHFFQYALNTLLIILSVPAVSLLYINHGARISWVFPIVLMVVSLVFSKRSILIIVTALSMIVQLMIWVYVDKAPYQLTVFDVVIRLVFYIVVFLIGIYINSVYRSKLKENAAQIELQKMISDISYHFAHVDRTNIDEHIRRLLEKIGLYYQADRCYIFIFDHEQGLINSKYEWCRPGITSELAVFKPCPISKYQDFINDMSGNATMYFDDVRKVSSKLISDSDFLIDKNVASLLSAPLESAGTMYGFLGFSSNQGPMNITDGSLEILQTFANLIADKLKMVRAEENIEYLAYHDQLTGLPNRVLFSDRVTQAIHLAARQSKLLGIVYIDLNGFNTVNDTFGHGIGDAVLKDISVKLKNHLRKTDTVARLGGDDFLVLLNDISDCDAIPKIARNLMSLFYAPVRLEEQEFFITASAGIAVYPVDGEDSETLIKHADLAMYKAKTNGINQFVLCTDDMKEEVRQNMILSNSLYRSLERGELSVYYQPQIHLGTEKMIGVEALLRWNHTTFGMIPPTVFIPLAEKNGLIGVIGEWVLRTACAQNKKWQEMGYPRRRISVNLSVVQLRNPRLPEIISDILRETGLAPGDLELEITESAATEESLALTSILKSLKDLGITISIDDFGTEYSSLNRLRELPIDRLKIDMQFVQALEKSEKDQAIAVTIINLAKNLGLQVVAEGVETALQLEFLRSSNCDEVQGFYYFRPMPPDELERIIS